MKKNCDTITHTQFLLSYTAYHIYVVFVVFSILNSGTAYYEQTLFSVTTLPLHRYDIDRILSNAKIVNMSIIW